MTAKWSKKKRNELHLYSYFLVDFSLWKKKQYLDKNFMVISWHSDIEKKRTLLCDSWYAIFSFLSFLKYFEAVLIFFEVQSFDFWWDLGSKDNLISHEKSSILWHLFTLRFPSLLGFVLRSKEVHSSSHSRYCSCSDYCVQNGKYGLCPHFSSFPFLPSVQHSNLPNKRTGATTEFWE